MFRLSYICRFLTIVVGCSNTQNTLVDPRILGLIGPREAPLKNLERENTPILLSAASTQNALRNAGILLDRRQQNVIADEKRMSDK